MTDETAAHRAFETSVKRIIEETRSPGLKPLEEVLATVACLQPSFAYEASEIPVRACGGCAGAWE